MPFGNTFDTPWWLRSGHAQTILPARFTRHRRITFRRERWDTPDGDFIDLDWTTHATVPGAPLVVMFHGLEGSSQSGYCRALMSALLARGWNGCVPHFRGCSGEINRLPRAYHSGDYEEVGWILQRLRAQHGRPLRAAGVSLGGNALLRYLGAEATKRQFSPTLYRRDAIHEALGNDVPKPLWIGAFALAVGAPSER